MTRKHHNIGLWAALAAALLLAACNPDRTETFYFTATIEQPQSDSTATPSTKTYMHHEQWVYWELNDDITIAGNDGDDGEAAGWAHLRKPDAGTDFADAPYNAAFHTDLPYGSNTFLALYPYNINNSITRSSGNFTNPTLILPAVQPLRPADDEDIDYTFGSNVYPMVAWYSGGSNDLEYNLDFHSLAGILRLQLFNNSSPHVDVTIKEIQIVSPDKQLSGPVTIKDFKTANPKPVSTSTTLANRTITIDCGDGVPLDTMRSFYIVLPAYGGENQTTTYNSLQITVVTTDGGKKCVKTLPSTNVRRRSITYSPAMGLVTWNGGSGSVSRGLTGNGSKLRPFKIYRVEDLQYIRSRFAYAHESSTTPTINGIEVTNDTYFKIMRSDIELLTSNWTSGIVGFKGKMSHYNFSSSTASIVNNSNKALFASIAAGAVVSDINVYRDAPTGSIGAFTLLCDENLGTIKNCIATGSINNTGGHSASICTYNRASGLIEGCGCATKFSTSTNNIAGICAYNYGTIKGCYTSSPMSVSCPNAINVAGICFHNYNAGKVIDCYFSARITNATSTINWGGIVFDNQVGGIVEHCYISDVATIITTGNVGGIVNTNNGNINYCFSWAPLRGKLLGGIVALMERGTLINSFCNDDLILLELIEGATADAAGGIVGAATGGTVANCFYYINHIQSHGTYGYEGGLVGRTSVGAYGAPVFNNCYAYEEVTTNHVFVGHDDGATYTNCHIVDGTQSIAGISGTTSSVSDLSALRTSLHYNLPVSPAGCKDWVLEGGRPVLEPYYIVPAR